jgi:S1-C subfamily serine protease
MKSNLAAYYSGVQRRLIFLLLLTAISAFVSGWLFVFSPEEEGPTQVYEKILPSVVRVEAIGSPETLLDTQADTLARPVASFPGQRQGYGFVWDKAGHIVTNFHLVQAANTIEIIFADETRAGAELLGGDLSTDLAVLKVNLPPDVLQPVILGDSTRLKVGQPALAIGRPLGQEFTMASGLISAVDQIMQGCESCYPITDVIQTDISLKLRDSGGPLLNEQGEVIGINTWIVSRGEDSTGISFALSSKAMAQVAPGLIDRD